ncbi:putative oxidoreductase EphD [Pontiella desulfatans]|uniref:Putative oxidoreductase EphD n=2 Tax=Pontiella desulfatans TaxID=2750659 RepID=A0A6C2UEK0_PONDE|nr:SDR family NAD(P)-dependent oxidoreductase [Pontiella desulfatans]VGO17636.1 putative oxidoreductase EphD [Pontiella desulfatans]
MKKILITGSTDGIGLETARMLADMGHQVLIHGRNPAKVEKLAAELGAESYVADLSDLTEVEALATAVAEKHETLDVLINNAGVFKVAEPVLGNGLDVRFVVNTVAPYLLTRKLLPMLGTSGRVVNLSSAAQAPVDLNALMGKTQLDDMGAYAQSKLAITMWSMEMAKELGTNGPAVIAVNPGSLLASKMVREGFGVTGSDLGIGVDILCRAALSDEFADASGKYYDNDSKRFANPQADALNPAMRKEVVRSIESLIH